MSRASKGGKRPSQRDFEQLMGGAGTCSTCGKTRYLTKSDAKKAIRQMPSRANRLSAYACGNYWHTGRPPRGLVSGNQVRAEIGPAAMRTPHSWKSKDERKNR